MADDTAREPASEETPLLRSEGDAPLPDEASTKELIWILGSIWLGVFLAALGMINRFLPLFATNNLHRYDYRRYSLRAHLLILQFLLAALVARNFVPDLQCRLPAAQRPTDRYLFPSLGIGLL